MPQFQDCVWYGKKKNELISLLILKDNDYENMKRIYIPNAPAAMHIQLKAVTKSITLYIANNERFVFY